MAELTRLVRDDDYEEMGAAYQCVHVEVLDEALRVHGVADAATREEICQAFLFNMGSFHDQGWLKATPDGPRVCPLLGFSTGLLNTDTPVEEIGAVYVPSESFSFHEYASGSVAAFFEGDPAARIETGNFVMEDEDD
ncbi:hypothetical protein [Paludisphaera mucosa]|uniref:Uncharacterized protein n=1 Tax=Paludisphaera mucosa TaxID=3030827 RepID=A0ABT6FAH2_9BACT|nr:hypothetical protein [Paludisphaera mucosa]MDG3004593.1 hypothetical protein [Paludisphaera mucosa]